jgi:predicted nucleic acid-binding protein
VIVVDTNVILALAVPSAGTGAANRLYEIDGAWCAPSIWRHELRNALVRYCRASRLGWERAVLVMADAELQLAESDHQVESGAILRFARDSGCSPYDAEFAVLAEGLDLPLLTWDGELLRALPHRAVTPEDFLARG